MEVLNEIYFKIAVLFSIILIACCIVISQNGCGGEDGVTNEEVTDGTDGGTLPEHNDGEWDGVRYIVFITGEQLRECNRTTAGLRERVRLLTESLRVCEDTKRKHKGCRGKCQGDFHYREQ